MGLRRTANIINILNSLKPGGFTCASRGRGSNHFSHFKQFKHCTHFKHVQPWVSTCSTCLICWRSGGGPNTLNIFKHVQSPCSKHVYIVYHFKAHGLNMLNMVKLCQNIQNVWTPLGTFKAPWFHNVGDVEELGGPAEANHFNYLYHFQSPGSNMLNLF